jgi:hypothetical protein
MIVNNFEILFVSQTDYNCLVVEILFSGQRLCQISKEEGNDKMKILFLSDLYILKDTIEMEFSLHEFLKVISIAKKELSICKPVVYDT